MYLHIFATPSCLAVVGHRKEIPSHILIINNMKAFFSLVAGLALATSALAGPGTKKAAATFKVNPAKSSVTWVGKKVTGEHTGKVNFQDGTIVTDGKAFTGGTFNVNMKSITCTDITDPETNGKLIGHLSSPDFFDIGNHGVAKLVVTKVAKTGANTYDVTGDLTIKGITKPVTFPATVVISGAGATAKATVKVDRTAYDIKFGSGKFFEGLGDKVIYDDFTLDLNVVAGK